MDSFVIDGNAQVLLKKEGGETVVVKGGMTAEGFRVLSTYAKGWLTFAYLQDHQGIWWFNARANKANLFTQDTEAFRVVHEDYSCDSQYVYLEDKPVSPSDPDSFGPLSGTPYFARDNYRLYVKDSQHFHLFDEIDTYGAIAKHDYCTDSDHLFHLSSGLRYANEYKHEMLEWLRQHYPDTPGWWQVDYVNQADEAVQLEGNWHATATSVFYRTESGGGYGRDAKETFHLVRGVDRSSFEPLDEQYARDRDRVYFKWRTIRGIDPKSFESLGGRFGRDKQHVYYNGYRVEGADVLTFEVLGGTEHLGLSRDQNHVYHAQYARTIQPYGHPDDVLQRIKGADTVTFELLTPSGSWAVDANRVYLWGTANKKIDRTSFTHLFEAYPQSWAKDRNSLYNANGKRTVKGIDGASFVVLNRYWGKDDQAVFSFVTGGVYKTADAETFQVTDAEGSAEDELFFYAVAEGVVRKKKKT
ncbi:DKNYY domain-containing protein [Paenibacillus sp. TSA_86.1]|uniref:DKNYY domain-containing protein n=1 Tax=Paenibacillus sp. TSA_86.1 TaxID=3415649 RepID=UPI004045EACA